MKTEVSPERHFGGFREMIANAAQRSPLPPSRSCGLAMRAACDILEPAREKVQGLRRISNFRLSPNQRDCEGLRACWRRAIVQPARRDRCYAAYPLGQSGYSQPYRTASLKIAGVMVNTTREFLWAARRSAGRDGSRMQPLRSAGGPTGPAGEASLECRARAVGIVIAGYPR